MFDPTKPVQTRDGRPVRILATDANVPGWNAASDPVVGLILQENGREWIATWQADGTYAEPGALENDDLINVPEPATETYHVLRDGHPGHASLGDALEFMDHYGSLGIIKVTRRGGRVEDVDLAYARS